MPKFALTSLAACALLIAPAAADQITPTDGQMVIAQREGGGGGMGGTGMGGTGRGGGGGGGPAVGGGGGAGSGPAVRGGGPGGGDGPGRAFRGEGPRGDGPRGDRGGRIERGDRDDAGRAFRGERRDFDRGPRRADPGDRGDRDGRRAYRSGHRYDRDHVRRRGHRYIWGPGLAFYFYDGAYYGDCGWLERRAVVTGSPYWWRRYRNCVNWY